MAEDYIGPYRIVDKLGSGGMGEVFKARDERLDRWVAIKRIRPGKEGAEETRERFQREAKATAQLNHPAIVHVYDIFQDGESDCIVMEYIEGRTLQAYCAEKSLDPMRAAALGHQIAEGLAEAHSKKILHRDLKTENVIVTPEGQAKILDFGLAKPLMTGDLDDPNLTGKGQLVGTSRAMSPEYVGGDQVDHRADLFSLGVLLYELTTQRSPFKAQNTLATLKQVIIHHQVPARELNAEVPQELSDLIDRLLEKLPADRPANARVVADELALIAGQFSGSFDSISSQIRMSGELSESWATVSSTIIDPRYRRYWILFSVLLTVALVGAYLLGRSKFITPADGPNGPDQVDSRVEEIIVPELVVLGEFESMSGAEGPLVDSVKEAFRIGVEQSRNVRILSEIQLRDALKRMQRDPTTPITRDVGIEVCQREDAKALIVGRIAKFGEAYSISAEVIDPRNGESLFLASEKAVNESAIIDALGLVAQEVREDLGDTTVATGAEQPLHKVTTGNLEALKAYTAGISRWNATELVEAEPLLKRAILLDPEFAMAHAKLAVLYNNLGRDSSQTLHHVQQALNLPERLTEYERLYIEGWKANWLETPDEIIRAWSLVRDLYPDRPGGHYNAAMGLWLFRLNFENASVAFEKSVDLYVGEQQTNARLHLAFCRIALKEWEAAQEVLGRVDGRAGFESMLNLAMSVPFDGEGFQGPTYPLFPEDDDVGLLYYKAVYHFDRGRFQAAYDALMEIGDPQVLDDYMTWIVVLERLGEEAQRLDMMDQALARAREIQNDSSVAVRDLPFPFMAILGKLYARGGQPGKAQEILREISEKIGEREDHRWQSHLEILRGEINAAREDPLSAAKRFHDSLDLIESYQAHDSLANIYEESGDTDGAIAESLWMLEARSQSFTECLGCFVVFPNISAWASSLGRLGRLYEKKGEPEKARVFYQQLLEHWELPNDSQERKDAEEFLAGN